MRPVKGFRACLTKRSLVNGKRVAASDKSVVTGNGRMISGKAVAFGGDVQKGIDHERFGPDDAPEGRRSFHEPLLKGGHVGIPEDLQGHLRAEGDALRAADACFKVIEWFGFRRKDGCPHGAYLGTEAAPGASSRCQNGMSIRVHSLLLRA